MCRDRVRHAHLRGALGQPPVGQPCRSGDRRLGRTADPDRRAAVAHRARRHAHAHLGARAADGRVLVGERRPDGTDRRLDRGTAGRVVDAQHLELRLEMARTRAEDGTAAAQPVERHEGFRRHQGMAVGQHVDVGQQMGPGGQRRQPTQRRDRVVPGGRHGLVGRPRHTDVVADRHVERAGVVRRLARSPRAPRARHRTPTAGRTWCSATGSAAAGPMRPALPG